MTTIGKNELREILEAIEAVPGSTFTFDHSGDLRSIITELLDRRKDGLGTVSALERIAAIKYPSVDTIYAHRATIDYARDQATEALSCLTSIGVEAADMERAWYAFISANKTPSGQLAVRQGNIFKAGWDAALAASPSPQPVQEQEPVACRNFIADPCGSASCASCGKRRRDHHSLPGISP